MASIVVVVGIIVGWWSTCERGGIYVVGDGGVGGRWGAGWGRDKGFVGGSLKQFRGCVVL